MFLNDVLHLLSMYETMLVIVMNKGVSHMDVDYIGELHTMLGSVEALADCCYTLSICGSSQLLRERSLKRYVMYSEDICYYRGLLANRGC